MRQVNKKKKSLKLNGWSIQMCSNIVLCLKMYLAFQYIRTVKKNSKKQNACTAIIANLAWRYGWNVIIAHKTNVLIITFIS